MEEEERSERVVLLCWRKRLKGEEEEGLQTGKANERERLIWPSVSPCRDMLGKVGAERGEPVSTSSKQRTGERCLGSSEQEEHPLPLPSKDDLGPPSRCRTSLKGDRYSAIKS